MEDFKNPLPLTDDDISAVVDEIDRMLPEVRQHIVAKDIEIETLRDLRAVDQAQNWQLAKQLYELQRKIPNLLRDAGAKAGETIRRLRAQLRNKDDEIHLLNNDNAILETQTDQAEAQARAQHEESERLRSEIRAYQDASADEKKISNALRERVASLETLVTTLQEQLNISQVIAHRLETGSADLVESYEILKQRNMLLEGQLEHLGSNNQILQKRVDELSLANGDLNIKLANTEGEKTHLQAELKKERGVIANLNRALDEALHPRVEPPPRGPLLELIDIDAQPEAPVVAPAAEGEKSQTPPTEAEPAEQILLISDELLEEAHLAPAAAPVAAPVPEPAPRAMSRLTALFKKIGIERQPSAAGHAIPDARDEIEAKIAQVKLGDIVEITGDQYTGQLALVTQLTSSRIRTRFVMGTLKNGAADIVAPLIGNFKPRACLMVPVDDLGTLKPDNNLLVSQPACLPGKGESLRDYLTRTKLHRPLLEPNIVSKAFDPPPPV